MTQTIEFEGIRHDFPDDATQAEIAKALQTFTPPSMAEGLGRSFAEAVPILGAVANRLDAATNAALAPVVDPLLPDSYQKLPEPTFGERYQHAMDIQEGKDTSFRAQHPGLETGAEIVGGVASLGAGATTATGARLLGLTGNTLPEMMVQGAASGAGLTAADTYLRGDLANPDPEQIGIAAAEGGAVAGIAPGIGRVRQRGHRARARRDPGDLRSCW